MALTKIEARSLTVSTNKSSHSSVNNIINSLLLCFLAALCFSLLWILPFFQASSSLLSVLFSSLSQTTIYSINFPTPTSVFILGNLIVVVLIGESKVFSSRSSDLFCNDACFYDASFRVASIGEGDEKRALKNSDDDDEWEMGLGNCEELSKRADDFIARVNMQREIEASILSYRCELKTMKKKYRKKAFKSL